MVGRQRIRHGGSHLTPLAALALVLSINGGSVLAAGAPGELEHSFARARANFASSPFGRSLLLESTQDGSGRDGTVASGTVVAILEYPLEAVRSALDSPDDWCAVLILQLNVKSCRVGGDSGRIVTVVLGNKEAQQGTSTLRLELRVTELLAEPTRFHIELAADQGPLGSRNYRLSLAAMPAGPRQSFLRFTYAYEPGAVTRLAMRTYLETVARDKVGFTVVARSPSGVDELVTGMRGVLERNTMRYYLAIETCIAAATIAPGRQVRWRAETWFDATERYPRQLREVGRAEYLATKDSAAAQLSDGSDSR